jgi:hypothetical protein
MIEIVKAIAALCMIGGGSRDVGSLALVNNLQIACQQRMAKCLSSHMGSTELESRDWIILKCVSGEYKEKKK